MFSSMFLSGLIANFILCQSNGSKAAMLKTLRYEVLSKPTCKPAFRSPILFRQDQPASVLMYRSVLIICLASPGLGFTVQVPVTLIAFLNFK